MFVTNKKRGIHYEMAKLNSEKQKKICIYEKNKFGRIDFRFEGTK